MEECLLEFRHSHCYSRALQFDSPCFYWFYFIFVLTAVVCAQLLLPTAVPRQTGQLRELEFELEVLRVAF